jgi:single-strand DNA-binding protein
MLIATIFKSHPPEPVDSHHRRAAAVRNAPEKRPQFHIKNKAILIGFLGGDAEVRTGKNNQKFTTLSLATKTSYKDKESGEYISHTEWHRAIVFGKLGEFAATLKKGAHIQIGGEIRHTEYTPNKAKKPVRTDSIRVNSILKLDRAEKAAAEEQEANEELPFDEAAE